MDKKIKISAAGIWTAFMSLCFGIICVGGYNPYFMSLRTPILIAMTVCTLFVVVFIKKKIRLDFFLVFFLLTTIYILISAFMSADNDAVSKIAIVYISGTFLLTIEYPDNFIDSVIKAISVFVIVIALSIIISVFIDDCMNKYFSWLLNPYNKYEITQNIRNQVNVKHAYSGFARDNSDAAYIMSMGISIYLARFFSGIKLKKSDIAFLVIDIVALLLTNKRMMIICVLVAFAVMMLLAKRKGKVVTIVLALIIMASVFLIASAYIPQLSSVFDRFENSNNDYLTGRSDLWNFSIMMFNRSPIVGMGLGSFNNFVAGYGYTTPLGKEWIYYGHNIYLEFLGELGIIGCIIVFGSFLYTLSKTILLVRSTSITQTQKYFASFSLIVQIILLTYCASGNVFLYIDQTLMYFFAVMIVRTICINTKQLSTDKQYLRKYRGAQKWKRN